jgi:hypothetical protein
MSVYNPGKNLSYRDYLLGRDGIALEANARFRVVSELKNPKSEFCTS